MLLDSMMHLFANHPNASYLVLPPKKHRNSNLDPLGNFFIVTPMGVTHNQLFRIIYINDIEIIERSGECC